MEAGLDPHPAALHGERVRPGEEQAGAHLYGGAAVDTEQSGGGSALGGRAQRRPPAALGERGAAGVRLGEHGLEDGLEGVAVAGDGVAELHAVRVVQDELVRLVGRRDEAAPQGEGAVLGGDLVDQRRGGLYGEGQVSGVAALGEEGTVPVRTGQGQDQAVESAALVVDHAVLGAVGADGGEAPGLGGPLAGLALGVRYGGQVGQRYAGGERGPAGAGRRGLQREGENGARGDVDGLQRGGSDGLGGEFAGDLDGVVTRGVDVQGAGADDLHLDGEGAGDGRDDPDVGGHPVRGRVLAGVVLAAPQAGAVQPPCPGDGDGRGPYALVPLAARLEDRGVDDRREAGPVGVPQREVRGLHRGHRGGDGTGADDGAAALVPLAEDQHLAGPEAALRTEVAGEGVAAQQQLAVGPGRLLQAADDAALARAEGEDLGRNRRTALQEGVVRLRAGKTLDRHAVVVVALVVLERDEVLDAAFAGEVRLEPVGDGQVGPGAGADLADETADLLDERGAEVGAALADVLVDEREFLAQHVVVVVAQVTGVLGALLGLEGLADQAYGLHAVDEGDRVGGALGDGALAGLADAPVVDAVADDVDAGGEVVRGDADRGVLVEDALRVLEAVPVPEAAPVDLVPGGAVGDQRRELRDVGLQLGAGEGGPVSPGLLHADRAEALHIAAREVRTRLVQRLDEPLVGVVGHRVVTVDEGQVLAVLVGVTGAHVAGRAEARVVLHHDAEALVLGGERLGYDGAGVRGPVVHEDDLEVFEGLGCDGFQALVEVELDVVDGDDDAQARRHGWRFLQRFMLCR